MSDSQFLKMMARIDTPSRFTPVSAADVKKDLKAKFFVLEDILAKENLYTLTAKNNHGKSTLMALMIKCITDGSDFNGLRTVKGRVLLMSGENTADTMLKLLALDVDLSMVDIVDFPYDISAEIKNQLDSVTSEYVGVFVDSNQSYFGDGDMNGNADMLSHMQAFRRLTELKGNPFVVVLSHPIKNAQQDALIPYGGGSAINEIDSNLTLWNAGGVATFGIGKARQPSFEAMKLKLSVYTFHDRTNNFGKNETTSVFSFMTEDEAESAEIKEIQQKVDVLKHLNFDHQATYETLGSMFFVNGNPMPDEKTLASAKKRAERFVKKLIDEKMLQANKRLTKIGKDFIGV